MKRKRGAPRRLRRAALNLTFEQLSAMADQIVAKRKPRIVPRVAK